MIKNYQIQNKGGKGVVRIVGEINWWRNSGADFMKLVDTLIAEGVQDVEGYVNTPGGSMFEANEIGNQIARFKGKKTCKLGALCASAGTTVSTYFDEVEASKNTQYMIHDPISQPLILHESDYDSDKALYVNLRNNAIEQYHSKTGLDKETLSRMMQVTTWMSAKQALEKGFVDSISEDTDDMPDDAQNVFNKYNFVVPSMLNTALNKTNTETKKEKMNKKNLDALGLPEDATDEQITEAIDNLKKNQKPKEKNAEGADNTAMDLLLNVAKSKGMDEAMVKAAAKKDFNLASNLVKMAVPAKDSNGGNLSDIIAELKKQNSSTNTDVRADWDLKKWENEDPKGLENMIKNNFESYAKLFQAKHGVLPKKEDFNV